jgi:hypothetical protein
MECNTFSAKDLRAEELANVNPAAAVNRAQGVNRVTNVNPAG